MYIVTELMVNGKTMCVYFVVYVGFSLFLILGCLLQYLRHNKHLVEKTEIILDMAIQVCSAMKFLEQNKFIHRDLVSTCLD